MERFVFGLAGKTLVGCAWVGILALAILDPSGGAPLSPRQPEGDWRLGEPVSYENLTVFPVYGPSRVGTSEFLTLEEGLASGDIVVREQGPDALVRSRDPESRPQPRSEAPSVNQLVLVNRSRRPVLLLAGELLSGGKQDRIIAKDRIVPPGAEPLPLEVFCVEHGRWSSGSEFGSAKTMVHPSVREQAAVKQSQSEVWASVTAGTLVRGTAGSPPPRVASSEIVSVLSQDAPTESYEKIYDSRRVSGPVDVVVEQIEQRFRKATSERKGEPVVGVVVAYGGEVAWSDVFGSGELFQHYWNKLLRSYAVEAVARPTLREKASVEDARRFLEPLSGPERTESEPGVYRWREIQVGSLSEIELDSLTPKVVTVHRLVLRRTG